MEPNRELQAVFERLEEGLEDSLFAVLLVGEAEEELLLPAHRLPRGAQPGSWLRLYLINELLVRVELDSATTETRRARIQTKRSLLRNRRRKFTPRED